jgi:mono/diheme cytochrome c family protein
MSDEKKKYFMALLLLSVLFGGSNSAETNLQAHVVQDNMSGHWMAPKKAAERNNPISADGASLARGEKLYRTHCASCHGPSGEGDGPAAAALTPKPSDLREMAGEHPAGDLAWKIANGRGPMPAWKGILSGPQIWDLVNYLKSLRGAHRNSGSHEATHH